MPPNCSCRFTRGSTVYSRELRQLRPAFEVAGQLLRQLFALLVEPVHDVGVTRVDGQLTLYLGPAQLGGLNACFRLLQLFPLFEGELTFRGRRRVALSCCRPRRARGLCGGGLARLPPVRFEKGGVVAGVLTQAAFALE